MKLLKILFHDRSLGYKFTLLSVAPIIFVTVFIVLIIINSLENSLIGKTRIRALKLTELSALSMSNAFVIYNKNLLDNFVDSLQKEENINYAIIIDTSDGRILAHSDHRYDGLLFAEIHSRLIANRQRMLSPSSNARNRDTVHEVAAAINYQGKQYATIRVGFSLEEVFQEIDGIKDNIIFVALSAIVLGAFFSLFMARLRSKPIMALVEQAHRIGTGDFDHKIIYNSRDALGKLANSFNKMAFSLKDKQVQLEAEIVERKRAEHELLKAHDELEQRVAIRTLELSKANEQLKSEIEVRRQTETALHDSEERYRAISELVSDWAYSFRIDPQGNIICDWTTDAFTRITGFTTRELDGGDGWLNFTHPDDRSIVKKRLEAFAGGQSDVSEHRIITKNGEIRWLRDYGRPIGTDAKDGELRIYGAAQDITKTKLLQNQLVRSERLAATGQLTASIAHEINSPLQAIIVLLNTMQKKYKDIKEVMDNLDLLSGAFSSIRGTVKNLLDLNRPAKDVKQPVNINGIVEKTVRLMQSYLKKNKVNVSLNLSATIPEFIASPQQISQVLLNLINNAVEAITGESQSIGKSSKSAFGGEITVTTGLNRNQVVIKVADSGPGITDDELQQIFDPFYSNKKTMGMGVGLSICHGIILDLNGSIVAENIHGGGAVFIVSLPISPAGAAQEKPL